MKPEIFWLMVVASSLNEYAKCSRIWDVKPNYDNLDNQKCGSYDFRCVDKKSFQVCSYPAEYDEIDSVEIVYECNEGTYCDEDNPAFCSSDDPLFVSTKNAIQEDGNKDELIKRNNFQKRNQRKENKKTKFASKRIMNQITDDKKDEDEDYDRNWARLNEDSDFYFENGDNDTTEMPAEFLSEGGGGIDCQHYGYYPDNNNKSMFWLCDYNKDGKTFILRHMVCLDRRVFDPLLHECVLQGITRLTRNKSFSDTKSNLAGIEKNQSNSNNNNCSQVEIHQLGKSNQKYNEIHTKLDDHPLTIRIHQENSNCHCQAHILCCSNEGLRMKCPKHNNNQNICQSTPLVLCHDRDRIRENN